MGDVYDYVRPRHSGSAEHDELDDDLDDDDLDDDFWNCDDEEDEEDDEEDDNDPRSVIQKARDAFESACESMLMAAGKNGKTAIPTAEQYFGIVPVGGGYRTIIGATSGEADLLLAPDAIILGTVQGLLDQGVDKYRLNFSISRVCESKASELLNVDLPSYKSCVIAHGGWGADGWFRGPERLNIDTKDQLKACLLAETQLDITHDFDLRRLARELAQNDKRFYIVTGKTAKKRFSGASVVAVYDPKRKKVRVSRKKKTADNVIQITHIRAVFGVVCGLLYWVDLRSTRRAKTKQELLLACYYDFRAAYRVGFTVADLRGLLKHHVTLPPLTLQPSTTEERMFMYVVQRMHAALAKD